MDHRRIAQIQSAEAGALYIIHPCAHNPTGMDPSIDQWKQIMEALVKKKAICILDSAYQGYATGSLEKDREVPTYNFLFFYQFIKNNPAP